MTQQPRNPYGSDPRRQAGSDPYRRSSEADPYRQGAYPGRQAEPSSARPRAGRPDGAYGQTGRPNGAYTQANRAPYGRQGAGQRPAAGAPAYNRSRSQANRNRTAGGTEYSDYSRYIDQRQKRRRKSPLAIVVSLVILAAIGVGVYFFLNPLSFEVTVNGVKHTVDRGATLGTTLEEGMASPCLLYTSLSVLAARRRSAYAGRAQAHHRNREEATSWHH